MIDKKQGEFEFIKSFIGKFSRTGKDVIVGAGDDAGVVKVSGDEYLLATTDALVDGVHFKSALFRPEDVGRKSIAVNVSDIAAMGGRPAYCLVSLVLPKSLDESYKNRLYDGIVQECERYDIQIIGGNVSGGKELVVDVFLLGKVASDKVILRSGAKVGDKVLVTGSLGDAAAGLQLLKLKEIRGRENDRELRFRTSRNDNNLISKQLTPTPRLKEALMIAESGLATSMIDISDGLGQDIGHICDSSGVGVRIYEDRLLIGEGVVEVAERMGKKPLELVLLGGEDYELCFTASEKHVEKIKSAIESKTKTLVSVVGEILEKEVGRLLVLRNGEVVPLLDTGWDHFGS